MEILEKIILKFQQYLCYTISYNSLLKSIDQLLSKQYHKFKIKKWLNQK